jgi:hypothetical protein
MFITHMQITMEFCIIKELILDDNAHFLVLLVYPAILQ